MRRGFTLIEVLLALLLVSVGVVAVTGLLNSALDASGEARDDLHVVGFADLVLNHCHAINDWNAIPTTGSLALLNYDGSVAELTLGGTGRFTTRSIGRDGIPRERRVLTYSLDLRAEGRVKIITLRVWPGPVAKGRPRLFQTEIYDWTHANANP